ncbi:energy-coupling factor ABC transporter permease [Candidatus Sumerlaeota bacterium]|nr:energy-coupling factor ABC transporter permease [Candidatus Sumerlaeota bacterium]
MHIPDGGLISGPINAAAFAASVSICAAAVARAKKNLGEREIPLMGMSAAFVFAAQMVNFPIGGGTSGHFLGAAMTAILLGPLNACLVMALVLVMQCFLLADGGVTTLGTNILNMGLVGSFSGWGVYEVLRRALPATRASLLASASIASWIAVVLSAIACAFELALSGTTPARLVIPAMGGVHAIIGLGEALITAAVLSAILAARPDLIRAHAIALAVESEA